MRTTPLLLVLLLATTAPATTARAADAPFGAEACAEKVLRGLGSSIDAEDVFALSGVDPALGRGLEPAELAAALEKLGFVKPLARARDRDALWDELRADLAKDRSSAVLLDSGWRLVQPGEKETLKKDDLRATERVRFEPGEKLAERPKRLAPGALELARHCRDLRKKIPADWPVVIERPFVVTGDADVARYARSTVAWAVKLLRKDYFEKDPDEVIDIWLFDGETSYEKNVKRIFGEEPISPYGYYTPAHKALIMNIATGGGTLVHEIVHPFVRANFAKCPSWFNEGLASLYEQCEEKDGHIHGLPNWRLAGLQKAIRKGGLTSFEDLTGTSTSAFYGDDKGTNYAQARYLCYYLQEKGLLVDFWKKFAKDHRTDETGYESLKAVLGEKDMKDFQRRWEKWVLSLRDDR